MNNLIEETNNIFNEELKLINNKIKGTGFLEILKYRIIDKMRDRIKLSIDNLDSDIVDAKEYEDSEKKISLRFFFNKSPKIYLNTKFENNILIICLNENILLDIDGNKNEKKIKVKLIPFTGITISKNTNCNLNYIKNSLGIEINCVDKNLDIEKSEDSTI